MKIEKKLWITLFVFGLFAIGFSGWIFSQSTAREKLLWDNTIRFETKELTDGEIKSENIALPEDFDDPRSILFKTTHTIAEVWLDGEKIYEYGNEEDAPSFMKSPGSCWHIVNIPEDSAGKSLEVRIIPVYDNYYGNEVSIVYGTRGNCVLKICKHHLPAALFGSSAKKKKRQDRNEDRGLFKPWIFFIADCSMDTCTMWIPAVFDPGWKNLIFCGVFFTLSFSGAI